LDVPTWIENSSTRDDSRNKQLMKIPVFAAVRDLCKFGARKNCSEYGLCSFDPGVNQVEDFVLHAGKIVRHFSCCEGEMKVTDLLPPSISQIWSLAVVVLVAVRKPEVLHVHVAV
jgi:hypothetical protein